MLFRQEDFEKREQHPLIFCMTSQRFHTQIYNVHVCDTHRHTHTHTDTHTHTPVCIYIYVLCIAAAMWTRPHLICLDEPTNFLDKETFNGLVRALKNFKGAVLTISHNQEFVEQVYMRSLFIFSPHHFSSSCCLSLRINRSW